MAAYGAVISLKKTVNGLLNSSRISRELLELAHKDTRILEQALERSNKSSHDRLEGLEGPIRDIAHQLEDVLGFHELDSDGEVMRQEITSLGESIKRMVQDYVQELSRDDNDDDDDDDDDGDDEVINGDDDAAISVLSKLDFGVEMVGRSNLFTGTRDYLLILQRMTPDDLWFCAFRGEKGSGRTMYAKTIFEYARQHRYKQTFDCCAWVTVGPEDKLKQVLIRLIAQVDDNLADHDMLISQEDERLSKHLYKFLEKRRYMIVLDDVEDVELVNHLKTKSTFPDQGNGNIVFLTTTSKEVALLADKEHFVEYSNTYLEELIWPAICEWYFGIESVVSAEMEVSAEIEVAGKKIIQNCRGLMIAVAKTLLFLLKSESTVEQWSKIAADEQNPTFMITDEISEIRQIKKEMQQYSREKVGNNSSIA